MQASQMCKDVPEVLNIDRVLDIDFLAIPTDT